MQGDMLMRQFTALLCIGLWCMQSAAPAAEPQPAEIDRPCIEGSPEFVDVEKKLAALDGQIRTLKPDSDHRPANEALMALMRHQCLALANVDENALHAEAAPALTEFWEAGGRQWAESVLKLDKRRELVLPPLMRKVVAKESRPDLSALSVLCSLAEAECGKETLGWSARAQAFFTSQARQVPHFDAPDTPSASITPLWETKLATEEYCKDLATAQTEARQYEEWAQCIASIPQRGPVMPLGRIKAPKSGWLVVRHSGGWVSSPCEDVRIYSLATGAAYISRSCAWNGIDKVLPERKLVLEPGSVAMDNVREAAWMMLQMRDVTVASRNYPVAWKVPVGVKLEKIRSGRFGTRQLTLICSDQSVMYWALLSATGEVVVSSTVRVPACDAPGVDYARQLLRIVESGFVEGCPTEAPPKEMSTGNPGPLGSKPAERQPVYADVGIMTKAFQMARTACPPRR
jgi:hypothetical protein